MNSRVEWRPLPVVLHKQEVRRRAALNLHLRDCVPLVGTRVRIHARVVQLGCMVEFILNMATSSALKRSAHLFRLLHLGKLPTYSLYHVVRGHLLMPFARVLAGAWRHLHGS